VSLLNVTFFPILTLFVGEFDVKTVPKNSAGMV
jgi:hypothetical protein